MNIDEEFVENQIKFLFGKYYENSINNEIIYRKK